MIKKKKILIVEDDKQISALVNMHMKMSGYDTSITFDGEEAIKAIKEHCPDIIILDLMLPKLDGWEVCKRLRQEPQTRHLPVIMLTCRTEIEDKLKGFDLGADDYVTKPFSPRELVARVKRVLARAERHSALPKKYTFGKLEINFVDSVVRVEGKEVYLTRKEAEILKALVERQGELLTYDQILDEVWREDIVEYGNIDVHIRHLREKIEKDPNNPRFIKTVKGEGYKFESE